MEIRPATPVDAGAIAAIHVSSSQEAYRGIIPEEVLLSFTVERREATWREILTTKDGEVWIAEEGGRPLGWICVGKSRDPDADPTVAELRAMYIAPDCWRQGVGRALWQQAEAYLRAERYARVTLWVLEKNTRADELLPENRLSGGSGAGDQP